MPVEDINSKKNKTKQNIKEAGSVDSAVLFSLVTHFFSEPPPLHDHSCLSQRLHSVDYNSAVIHKEMAFTAMYLQSYSIYIDRHTHTHTQTHTQCSLL